MVKTKGIRVVGYQNFTTKDGSEMNVVHYVAPSDYKGFQGVETGFFYQSGKCDLEIDENYNAVLGYNKNGKFGVIGILG